MALTEETPWCLAGSWETCYKVFHDNLSAQVCKYYTFIYYGNIIIIFGSLIIYCLLPYNM